jgi:hypothetical protein
MMRTKSFAWLLLNDRVNTRDMLLHKNWNVTKDTHCVLCPTRAYEDILHLFFNYNFSQRVWSYLQTDWSQAQDIQAVAFAARNDFAKPFFMEVVIIALWNIWKERNGQIFKMRDLLFLAGDVVSYMICPCFLFVYICTLLGAELE